MRMSITTGFYMIFEGNKVDEKAKRFLKLIKPHCTPPSKPKYYKEGSFEGYSEIYVNMYYKDGVMRGLYFSLNFQRNEDTGNRATLSFTTDFSIAASKENSEILYNIFLEVAAKLDPVFGSDINATDLTGPCEFPVEYYENPYFFCVEPKLRKISIEERDRLRVGSTLLHDFLHNKDLESKLEEIKRVMGREELVALLKKYCRKVVLGEHGVGILKNMTEGHREFYVYPRYFIRKELRKRGVHLDEGLAEKYAKELGIK
jgi:hypothetical protein